MKINHIITGLLLLFIWKVGQAQDTITVDIGTRAKVIIYAEDRNALYDLKDVDINEIIKQVTEGIDSTEQVITYEYRNQKSTIELERVVVAKENTWEEGEESWESKQGWEDDWDNEWNGWEGNGKGGTRPYVLVRFDIGLNNFMKNGSLLEEGSNVPYELDLLNSRYVAIGIFSGARFGGNKGSFIAQVGAEISWFNFMFNGNDYIVKGPNGIEFRDYQTDFGQDLKRSKLVAAYVNIPMMIGFELRNRLGEKVFNIGLGGFVGYKLRSYSKTKFEKEVNREEGDFNLNNVRYGLEGQLGFGEVDMFIRYDLNTVFSSDTSPELNAVSFGIRI